MIIAQLTDLHIKEEGKFAYQTVDTYGALQRAVTHLNDFRPAIDMVVVSGDLGDFGTQAEYNLLRQELNRLHMPYHVIPGNHDDYRVMRKAFSDHTYLATEGPLTFSIFREGLRIIGLDTSVPGRPEGHMDTEKQAWLKHELTTHKNEPTLIFMHHPPFETGIHHMDEIMLQNAEVDFWPLLEGHDQVLHIACGHVHRTIETMKHGIPVSIGSCVAHQVTLDLDPTSRPSFTMDPPAIRLFLWQNNALVSHQSFLGDFPGPHPFFDQEGGLID
ncbi:phosphodiesterase [Pseudovibrio exalbescens]|uniref:Phosphodiesterase n=1 Tax=Pseudovibrio exalbescens TaxID=197461 RepID=A0A1U7JK56_9HYPH|nr:phosphodiesterase [Pseudovibrio exalbescens]OKL45074.1 phosphodiesterase [Pseudovibrio exalbescens]